MWALVPSSRNFFTTYKLNTIFQLKNVLYISQLSVNYRYGYGGDIRVISIVEGLTPTEARSVILPYIFRFAISNSRKEFVCTIVVLVNATNNSISFIQVHPINAEPILEEVVPASRSSIEAIPMVKVIGEGIDCSICLSGFEISEEAKEMPCKHHFHSICIDKWLGINGSCLICRYKMPVDEQCEKKDEESGGDERGDDGGSHMEEDGVKFIFHVIITPETTHLTVSITEVHRRSDDMLLEVGDCVVYEVGNGDVSEAGNGDESIYPKMEMAMNPKLDMAMYPKAQAGDSGDDDESETQDMVIDNN